MARLLSRFSRHKGALLKHCESLGIRMGTDSKMNVLDPDCADAIRTVPSYIDKPPYALAGASRVPPKQNEIEIKTMAQIQRMRDACEVAREVLNETAEFVKVGVTTDRLDEVAHHVSVSRRAYPSPLLYRDYPRSICTSVNEVACHGIPSSRVLQDGDIINIDVTVFYNGYHGDVSETYMVGAVSSENKDLIEIARICRDDAIGACGPGVTFDTIGKTISEISEMTGYQVVPNFCGHGIGKFFHGPPDILHYDNVDVTQMKEGMTFTVEPIVCAGNPEIKILNDGWTAVTLDSSWSAQFEHTVLITEHGPEILTL